MEDPRLALFSVSSIRTTDLRETIDVLKRCMHRIRRRVVFSKVLTAAGSIEVAVASNSKKWNVHAHVVLDVWHLDVGEVQRQWRRLVREYGRRSGTFGVEQLIKDQRALSVYIAKHHTWCPPAGEMPLWKLNILLKPTKGLRLPIEWGFRAHELKVEGSAK